MTEPAAYRIDWDGCDAATWDRWLTQMPAPPLVQSWAYGEVTAAAEGSRARRGVICHGREPVAILQTIEKRFAGLRLVKLFRGPLWLGAAPAPTESAAVLTLLRRQFRLWRGTLLLFMPELADSAENATRLRAAGFVRVVTGASSIRISLQESEEALRAGLDGKWRNALVRAESAGLAVETDGGAPARDWLLARYAELKRARKFKGPEAAFLGALVAASDPSRDVFVLRALENTEPIAGVLLVRHGGAVTYLVGWTSDAGRRTNAHNLLLWQAMLTLKDRGLATLDIGNLDPDTPGIAAFKLGLRGTPYTLAGVFV
jgi:hypothetical protein